MILHTYKKYLSFIVYFGYMTLPFPHIILVHFYILPIFRQKRCASCRNRYRNRNVRNRRRLNNARDENRYRSRGSNNNNRNRDQPSRQGFGFENNFWTDGDANDFFRFVYLLILCILKNKTEMSSSHIGFENGAKTSKNLKKQRKKTSICFV